MSRIGIPTIERAMHWRVSVLAIENPMDPEGATHVIRQYREEMNAEQHPAATTLYYACASKTRDASWTGVGRAVVTLEDSEDGERWGVVKRIGYPFVNCPALLATLAEWSPS